MKRRIDLMQDADETVCRSSRRLWRHVTRGAGNESGKESKGHDRNVDDNESARCSSASRRLRPGPAGR